MAYLSGHDCVVTLAGVTTWVGDITSFRQKQIKDSTQVKVCGQANASTVTGAYHTQYTIDIAVADDLAQDDLAVGTTGELELVYQGGAGTTDQMTCTVVIVDSELSYAHDGAVVGTLILDGNSALVHLVNQTP